MFNSYTNYDFPFPVIVQRTVFSDTESLNLELEKFIEFIIKTKPDATNKNYIATESAKQVDCNILVDYYNKEKCITDLMDEIINPEVKKWTKKHFDSLLNREIINPLYHMTSWATLYGPGSWQTPHIHREKMFTGVYYFKMNDSAENLNNDAECTNDVQIQPPDMRSEGSLVIQNPHPQSCQPLLGGWQTHKEYLPVEGELIIMPSWVSHYPKPFKQGKRGVIVFDGAFLGENNG